MLRGKMKRPPAAAGGVERLAHPSGPEGTAYFCFGGGGDFTGGAFAPFFGFFFSLPCELLPLPIAHLGSGWW